MAIELRILGGARTGHKEVFDKAVISVGRHPLSDLRFDPRQDLDVSTRHGEVRLVDGKYSVYDARSTNGTFVNGQRVTPGGMQELHDNDVIAFGFQGPSVSVRITDGVGPTGGRGGTGERAQRSGTPPHATSQNIQAASTTAPPAPPPLAPPSARPMASAAAKQRTTGERVAIAVAQQTRTLRIAVVAAVVVLGGLAGVVFYQSSRDKAASQAQIDQLISENTQARQAFETKLQGDTALTNSLRRRNDSLVRLARDARGAQQAAAAEQLRQDHDLQRRISAMDPTAIARANERGIALISTQIGTKPSEATGFVVSASGLVITNRHVVVDDSGVKANRIFVKLAANSGTRRAHVVRVMTDSLADLALLQIEGAGPFPVVRSVAASVDAAVGAAVVTLGYPLGTDLPMEASSVVPTLTMGVVSRTITDLLQIDSFASHGASGSPVFDTHGHVIGVVWGGPKDGGGRIVYAVPANRITELIKGAP